MILRRIGSWLLLSALMLGTAYYLWLWPGGTEAVFAPARGEGRTLVLHAGHGGEDAGAVSRASFLYFCPFRAIIEGEPIPTL